MVPQWQTGIVKQIEHTTPDIRRYWIELPETEVFSFKPGQFVTLDLPIHEQRNKRWRSYSIASMPDGSNVIELIIVLQQGGLGTGYLFNEITEGSSLTLRGPQGVFTLPEDLNKPVYFICTGTGIAPFRSMLHYIQYHNIPISNIHLVFGTRNKEGLLYHTEMLELEKNIPGFYYHPTLSRDNWDGHKGYVHPVYESLIGDEKTEAKFMLCGWRMMIDEAKQRLIAMGYSSKDIELELYG